MLLFTGPLYAAQPAFSFVENFQSRAGLDSGLTDARWTTGSMTLSHARYRQATGFWTSRARLGHSSDTTVLIDDIGLRDMDGDARLDVITASNDSGISIYFIGETGSLTSTQSASALAAIRPVTVTTKPARDMDFGDFDRDGDLDIVAAAKGSRVRIYKNNGSGVFTAVKVSTMRARDVAAADMDGDGDLDLVVTGRSGAGVVRVYLNDGRANFLLHDRLPVATYSISRTLGIGDLNGDGHPDIVLGKRQAANVYYLNDGGGGFGAAQSLPYAGETSLIKSVALGDVDNDGDLDIVMSTRRRHNVLYRNDGGLRFTRRIVARRAGTLEVKLADMDGDGDLDLVEGGRVSSYVHKNAGTGVFGANGSYIGPRSRAVALGDVDGDGDPDVVLGERIAALEAVSMEGWSGIARDAVGVAYDNWRGWIVSRKINGDTPVPPLVVLTAAAQQPLHTEVIYYLSNNGGARWYRAYPGVRVRFLSPGNDLRWKARLKTRLPSLTPVLTQIRIDGTAANRRILLGAPSPVAEGAAIAFTVGLGAGETTSDGAVSVAWMIGKNGDVPIEPKDLLGSNNRRLRIFPRGVAVIPNGAREVTITVPTFDDTRVETTETYTVVLSNPVGAELAATSSRVGRIGASDLERLPLRPLQFPAVPAAVEEGADIRFTVAIDAHSMSCSVCHLYGQGDFSLSIDPARIPPVGTVAATWSIRGSGDNPASPSDFADFDGDPLTEFPTGVAVIPNDRREVTITVPTFDDDTNEGAKTYTVFLSEPRLGARLAGAVSRNGAIGDRADETTVAITADRANVDEGGAVVFTVTLAGGRHTADVIVPFTVSGDAADYDITTPAGLPASATTGALTMAVGATTGEIVLAIADDDDFESAETVQVGVDTPYTAAGGLRLDAPSGASVIINPSDLLSASLSIPTTPTAAEGTTLTFTVVLGDGETPAITTARVAWNISSATGALGTVTPQDFTDAEGDALEDFPGGIAVIARGTTSTTVSVATFDDNANEATETYIITLGAVIGASLGVSTRTGVISDHADETVVTIAADRARVDEGSTAAFTVTLSGGARTADVEVPFTVTVSDGGGSHANASPDGVISGIAESGGGLVRFTVGDAVSTATAILTIGAATTAAEITLTITDDDLSEEAETLQVNLGTPRTSAGSVRPGGASSATVTINASGPLPVRHIHLSAPLSVTEGSTLLFTVSIADDEPVSDGTISVAWAITGADVLRRSIPDRYNDELRSDIADRYIEFWSRNFTGRSDPYDFNDARGHALRFYPSGTAVIPAGRRSVVVRVPTNGDSRYEEKDEAFRITLTRPSGGVLSASSTRTVRMNDNYRGIQEATVRRISLPAAPEAVDEGAAIRFTIAATPDPAFRLYCGWGSLTCVLHRAEGGDIAYNRGILGSYRVGLELRERIESLRSGGKLNTPFIRKHPTRFVIAYWWLVEHGPDSAVPSDFSRIDDRGARLYSNSVRPSDYPRGYVVIPADSTSVTVTIPTADDSLIEEAEGYTVLVSLGNQWTNFRGSSNVSRGAMAGDAVVWNRDVSRNGIINASDHQPLPLSIPTTPTTVAEGATLTFTVVLGDGETPAITTASVAWNISSATGALGTVTPQDFADAEGEALEDFPGGVAVIARGTTSTLVSVATFDDNAKEATETYIITLDEPPGARAIWTGTTWARVAQRGISTRTGVISDHADETVVTIAADRVRVDEGDTAAFTVTLSGGARTADVEVPFTVTVSDGGSGLANASPDGVISGIAESGGGLVRFTVGDAVSTATATLTIGAATTTAGITLTITDDDLSEEAETLQVNLGTPRTSGGARLGDASSATVTINASDVRHIGLSAPSSVDEGSTLSFTVSIGDDGPVSDGTVSVAWAISGNDELWRSLPAEFWRLPYIEFSRLSSNGEAVPQDFADARGNMLDVYPSGTAVIPAGRRSVVVRVPTYDDSHYERKNEAFRITLTRPSGGVLSASSFLTVRLNDGYQDIIEVPIRRIILPAAPEVVDEGTAIRFTIAVTHAPEFRLYCGRHVNTCVLRKAGGGDIANNDDIAGHSPVGLELREYIESFRSNGNLNTPFIPRVATGTIIAHWHLAERRPDSAAPSDFSWDDYPGRGSPSDYPFGAAVIPADSTSVTVTIPTVDDSLMEEAEGYTVAAGLGGWWTTYGEDWGNVRAGAMVAGGVIWNRYVSQNGIINASDQSPLLTVPTTVAEGATLTFTAVLGDGETPAITTTNLVWNISSATGALGTATPQDFADTEGDALEDFPGGIAVIARGTTSALVSVATFDDNINEATETYIITLSTRHGVSTQTGGISDHADETVVTIAADRARVDEGDTAAFTVALSGGARTADVEVPFTVTGDRADYDLASPPARAAVTTATWMFPTDATTATVVQHRHGFDIATGTLTITTATTTALIALTITDDDRFEEAETLQVNLGTPRTSAGGVRLGGASSATVVIRAGDQPELSFLSASPAVAEGAAITFTIGIGNGPIVTAFETGAAWSIRGGGDNPVRAADFADANGAARRSFPSGIAVIPGGAREATITVPTFDDPKVEVTQTFTISLSNPRGGATLGASVQSGVIGLSDFERLPIRSLRISNAPGAVEEGASIRFTVSIDTHILSCAVCHSPESLFVSDPYRRSFAVVIDEDLRPPHGTIAAVWSVTGSGDNPARPQDFADAEGNALTDYPTGVAIIPNSRRDVTITVPTIDDTEDGGIRTYTVSLSNPGLSARIASPRLQTGVINDNESLPLSIPTTPTVAEGATLTFTVVIGDGGTPVGEAVGVVWNISTGTGAASRITPQDFADGEGEALEDFPGGVAVIARGTTSTTVSVATFDDNANEATETYIITLGDRSGAGVIWTGTTWTRVAQRGISTQTGVISDHADETVVTIAADRARVDEGDTAAFTVTLSGGARTADVEVPFTVTVSDGGGSGANAPPDGVISGIAESGGGLVRFTVGDAVSTATAILTISTATTTALITLTITDDDLSEEAETLQVNLGVPRTSAGGVRLGGASGASVTINASDPLPARHIRLSAPSSVTEGSTLSFTVSIGDDEPVSDGTVSAAWAVGTDDDFWRDHPYFRVLHLPYNWDLSFINGATPRDFYDAPSGNEFVFYPYGTAVIPAGRRSVVVRVPTYDDSLYEGNETFRITLARPSGGVLSAPSFRVVRIEEGYQDIVEVPVRRISLPAAPEAVDEGTALRFTVVVTHDPAFRLYCGRQGDACVLHRTAGGDIANNGGLSGDFRVVVKLREYIESFRSNGSLITPFIPRVATSTVTAYWELDEHRTNSAASSDFSWDDYPGRVSPSDYPAGAAAIPADSTSVTVTIPTVDDSLIEEAEGYTVIVGVGSSWTSYREDWQNVRAGAMVAGSVVWYRGVFQHSIINASDQPPSPTIPTTPTTVAEGATLTFTVVLGDGETPAITTTNVAWNISTGTGALGTVAPQDFADAEGEALEDFPGGVAVIARGTTSTTVSVATFDDNANEATETYIITLGEPSGTRAIWTGTTWTQVVQRGVSTRTGVISDHADETVVTIAADRARVDEGDTAAFIVTLSGGARTADVEVPFTVTGDRADYDLVSPPARAATTTATWMFSTGAATATVVQHRHDSDIAAGTLTITTATITAVIELAITDDDLSEEAETLQVHLGTPRTSAGGARLGGARSATAAINASDRVITVGFATTGSGTHSNARESNRDVQLCVDVLSPARPVSLGDAQISLAATTVAGSAGADDFTAINGRTVATLDDDHRRRCFFVALTDDPSPESTETFRVDLATAQTAGVGRVVVAPASVTVTIVDDDAIHVGWAPQSRAVTVREGDGAVTLTAVVLSPAADVPIASGDFRLMVNTHNRTAAAPGDFTALTNRIIAFGDDVRSASVVIPVLDDDLSEMTTETFSVRLDFAPADTSAPNIILPTIRTTVAGISIAPSDPPVPKPTVNAGHDQVAVAESTGTGVVSSATTVTLDGTVTRSVSDTGSTLFHFWEQVSEDSTAATVIQPGDAGFAGPIVGPVGITDEAAASSATVAGIVSTATAPIATVAFFSAPDVPRSRTYYFRLTAAAARAGTSSGTDSDIVAVTIDDIEPPTAAAFVRRDTVMEGTTSTLVGAATDPDGDSDLRYEWTQSPATPRLIIAGTATPVVTWPEVSAAGRGQVFTLTLTVTDSQGLTGTDTVLVVVQDDDVTVTIGPAQQSVKEGGEAVFTVTLTGGIPSSDIIVPYTIRSGGGGTDDDYTDGNSGSFTIAAGSAAPYTFTIRIRRDNIRESDETLFVTLGTPRVAPLHRPRRSAAGASGAVGVAASADEHPMNVGDPNEATVMMQDNDSLRVRLRVFLQGAVILENEDTP